MADPGPIILIVNILIDQTVSQKKQATQSAYIANPSSWPYDFREDFFKFYFHVPCQQMSQACDQFGPHGHIYSCGVYIYGTLNAAF